MVRRPNRRAIGAWVLDRSRKASRNRPRIECPEADRHEARWTVTIADEYADRPNSFGSPFGNASHGASRLVGDWYTAPVCDE
jgi:hypothetical protein